MRSKRLMGCLVVAFAISLTLIASAKQWSKPIDITPIQTQPPEKATPVLGRAPLVPPAAPTTALKVIGAIQVPPFISSIDIMFVDQLRGRLYIADRSNAGIDVIDAVHSTFLFRIPGFIDSSVGGINNAGPNGVLVTPDNVLWAGDSNSTLQVISLNATTPQINKSILTGPATDNRADELAYDPFDRIILIANDSSNPPRVTFINADTYALLGTIQFPDANGLEQPIWVTQKHAFMINVPGPSEYIATLDPGSMTITGKFSITDCPAFSTSGVNGLALGPWPHLGVSGCGNAYVVDGNAGTVINKISQVGGGDEVWYNEGDGQFYYVPLGLGNASVLGMVDASTGQWQQNITAARLRNVAAYAGNNHIFSVATRPTAGTPDLTPCVQFGFVNTGCVVVFGH